MPGLLLSPSAGSEGAPTGMKRAHAEQAAPGSNKKRKVHHELHHVQPIQHIVDPVSAELDPFGTSKDFFDQQIQRAIAIQCKSIGFDSARPEALEEFRAMVDSCTASLLAARLQRSFQTRADLP